jgi:hypothetical protein
MRRGLVLSVVMLACACACAQEPAFQADVSLVEGDAQVIGKTGVIDGLQARDFIVRENRRPMPIRYCFQEETPLDIFLLFET